MLYATFMVGTSYWLYLNATPKTVSYWCLLAIHLATLSACLWLSQTQKLTLSMSFSVSSIYYRDTRRWPIIAKCLQLAVGMATTRKSIVGKDGSGVERVNLLD